MFSQETHYNGKASCAPLAISCEHLIALENLFWNKLSDPPFADACHLFGHLHSCHVHVVHVFHFTRSCCYGSSVVASVRFAEGVRIIALVWIHQSCYYYYFDNQLIMPVIYQAQESKICWFQFFHCNECLDFWLLGFRLLIG